MQHKEDHAAQPPATLVEATVTTGLLQPHHGFWDSPFNDPSIGWAAAGAATTFVLGLVSIFLGVLAIQLPKKAIRKEREAEQKKKMEAQIASYTKSKHVIVALALELEDIETAIGIAVTQHANAFSREPHEIGLGSNAPVTLSPDGKKTRQYIDSHSYAARQKSAVQQISIGTAPLKVFEAYGRLLTDLPDPFPEEAAKYFSLTLSLQTRLSAAINAKANQSFIPPSEGTALITLARKVEDSCKRTRETIWNAHKRIEEIEHNGFI